MQDLYIINKLNAQAVEAHALKSRDTGKFGVAKYTGVNFHSYADFDTEAERNSAAAAWTNEGAGHRTTLHNPEAKAA